MKCKAKTEDGKKCTFQGRLKGYCVQHYVKYNYNKKHMKILQQWRQQRDELN